MNLLLIEDNLDFSNPAIEALAKSYDVTHCVDFISAERELARGNFGAAVSDCFFPYHAGSQNIQPGLDLVIKMRDADATEQRIIGELEQMSAVFDLTEAETFRFARSLSNGNPSGIVKNSLYRAIVQTFGEQRVTLPKMREGGFSTNGYASSLALDYYADMLRGIEKDEANQPLGLAMGHILQANGIPFVLATSTFHHDSLTQKIQDYAGKEHWTLIDCPQNNPGTKATSQYWENVVYELKRKL